jgi:hypothetical protein
MGMRKQAPMERGNESVAAPGTLASEFGTLVLIPDLPIPTYSSLSRFASTVTTENSLDWREGVFHHEAYQILDRLSTPMREKFTRYLAFLLFACVAGAQTTNDTNSPLWKRYFAASLDARDAQPWKIYRNLIAITPADKHLVWKKVPDGEMVKVVTWVWYDSASAPETYNVGPLTADPVYDDATLIWVTALPEIKVFCTNFAAEQRNTPLILRLQQVLGLPPTQVERSEFAEMWVRPADLIRPAPDPEISDHEAELDFPVSPEIVKINDAYKAWFLEHKSTVYTKPIPGTWTRLGYTYDWGNRVTHVGQSEFIVRPGAHLEVDSITPTEEYCR